MNKYGAKDMFRYFLKKYPNTDVTYTLYKYIISKLNKKIVDKVLKGKEFYFGHRLGTISIKRVERNFDKKSVNYFETKKLKAQGIDKVVYYTDDHWFRWYWAKAKCQVPNKSVYKFSPTSGPNGIKRALSNKLKQDEFAFLNYVKK
tara:strand:- start:650 stop:1087 length:438 start_codon:yes stop_codon:yes gene_type:complete